MTKKRIAVPANHAGMLDAHFGHCKHFYLYYVNDGKIQSEDIVNPPPHEPGVLPKWLAEKGVTDIIAGGMGQKAIQIFNANRLNVLLGAPQLTAKELVEKFLDNSLDLSGNYCDH